MTVLYDGECALCATSVRFIARRDGGRFAFASQLTPTGRGLLAGVGLPDDPGGVVLLADGRAFVGVAAVLGIGRGMGGVWGVLARVAGWLPGGLLRWAYGVLARNRRRWFGRPAVCAIPPAELRGRVLD